MNNLRGWADFLPRAFTILSAAQLAAAKTANSYTHEVLAAQGQDLEPAGEVNPYALSGIASDGRSLMSLLWTPAANASRAAQQGRSRVEQRASGQASLQMLTRTQIADAARVADGIAVASRPRGGYVRMLVGDSCPRCAILAGRFYRYSTGFQRHPQCDCTMIPSVEDVAGDLTTDPRITFDAGKIEGLSEADARAIRDGADLSQIVNAKSGMYVAGSNKYTRTGTTRRGLAGQRLKGAARLMPEQIYREASSREEAIRLLRLHGYII